MYLRNSLCTTAWLYTGYKNNQSVKFDKILFRLSLSPLNPNNDEYWTDMLLERSGYENL